MRTLVITAIVIVVLVFGGLVYALTKKPAQRPPSTEKIEATPERVARGKYLVEAVMACYDCHSERNLALYGFAAAKNTRGGGDKVCLDERQGFPGKICSPNITPHPELGIGSWSDGEILRAIREGVGKNGDALFPTMPYEYYRSLSDEDARAVVAFLRTLPPIAAARERSEVAFPVSFAIKLLPRPLDGPVPEPNKGDPVSYGKYLTEIAGCRACHTPVDEQHALIPGKDFSGGQAFMLDVGVVLKSANITSDEKTGIGAVTKEAFVARFKSFAGLDEAPPEVPIDRNTVMPWLSYAHMSEEDLSAIYEYLRTVPAISNPVRKLPPPRR